MDDVFLVTAIDDRRVICLSPLSRRTYREARGHGLGGDQGYFVYEVDALRPDAGIEIIAKAKSVDAAMRLYDLIAGTACRSAPARPWRGTAIAAPLPL